MWLCCVVVVCGCVWLCVSVWYGGGREGEGEPCVDSKRLRVYFKTSSFVPARAHVLKHVRVMPAYTGDVLNVHTGAF